MIQVLLVGPDDVLPHGKMRVNFRDCPRVGELIVWEKRSAANEYFRVTEVCWIFTGEAGIDYTPEVAVEPTDGP